MTDCAPIVKQLPSRFCLIPLSAVRSGCDGCWVLRRQRAGELACAGEPRLHRRAIVG